VSVEEFIQSLNNLIARDEVILSDHADEELINDLISLRDCVGGFDSGTPIEYSPNFPKWPCCLVLESDRFGKPIHVLWGLRKGTESPAVIITAYRPDPRRWDDTLLRRTK